MTREEFEKVVREALKGLPKRFRDKLRNVDVVIEESTGKGEFTGLYEGVPLTDRTAGYDMALPDKITLFKREIEAEARENRTSVREEVKRTVMHEIAHHFGSSDDRLEDLGAY